KQFLPLPYHPEIAVVDDDDLNGQRMIGDGGKLGDGHLEAAVAHNGEDQLIGTGELRADSGRDTKAHRAEAAGIDPKVRRVKTNELSGPHLMLADVGSDDGAAAGKAINFAHHVLGLDFGGGDVGREGM